MPRDSRSCVLCDGGEDEGLILLCADCDKPLHAHCVGFAGPSEGDDWLCGECEDLPADSEGHESGEEASVTAGA